jgi:hypothetical protein
MTTFTLTQPHAPGHAAIQAQRGAVFNAQVVRDAGEDIPVVVHVRHVPALVVNLPLTVALPQGEPVEVRQRAPRRPHTAREFACSLLTMAAGAAISYGSHVLVSQADDEMSPNSLAQVIGGGLLMGVGISIGLLGCWKSYKDLRGD